MLHGFKYYMKVRNDLAKLYTGIHSKPITKPVFKGVNPVETIKHCNVGMMPDGIIGKVKVFKKNGEEAYLNVVKIKSSMNEETYMLKDKIGKIIGEMDIKIRKAFDYDHLEFSEDPSHVFVEYLRNYSKPDTPYHKQGLEEYKGIGTKLLQIAQRRSDEACCMGNIKLHSKNESKEFYKKLGFAEEPASPYAICRGNQNRMYLPPEAKEPFSRRDGGL